MNEEEIVSSKAPEEKADVVDQTKADNFQNLLELAPFHSYFEASDSDKLDPAYQKKANLIWEYFKEGSAGPGETLLKMKDVLSSLGNSGFTPQLDRLYNWVSIKNQIKDLEKEARSYEQ